MFEYIFMTIIIFLVIFGLAGAIRAAALWLFSPKNDSGIFSVIPIEGHMEDIEYILRSAVIKMRWLGCKNGRVLALDHGADTETLHICKIIAEKNPFVILVTDGDLKNLLTQENETENNSVFLNNAD